MCMSYLWFSSMEHEKLPCYLMCMPWFCNHSHGEEKEGFLDETFSCLFSGPIHRSSAKFTEFKHSCLFSVFFLLIAQNWILKRTVQTQDVWVSCNPGRGTQDGNYDGTACVLEKHSALYTHDPNAPKSDPTFTAGGMASLSGGIGTENYPAKSCTELKKIPNIPSGMYWLQPSQDVPKFRGYCDMTR
jgi:hypothetical protein